jgi:prepilin-type N-terminal cleavage/methylation domain-containing protein
MKRAPAAVRTAERRQAGFTLTEMMIVVAIVGILVTMAIVYMRPRVRPIDVANRVGDLVREASRRAVALGQVRPNVAIALGSKARTQITAQPSATTMVFTLWQLVEDPNLASKAANWVSIASYTVDLNIVVVDSWTLGVVNAAAPGRTNDWTSWTQAAPPPPTHPPLQCRPDGTCDPCTLFFQAALPGPVCNPVGPSPSLHEQCGKLSVMPLGGAITTQTDWN